VLKKAAGAELSKNDQMSGCSQKNYGEMATVAQQRAYAEQAVRLNNARQKG
jgi:hypothetical protein